MKIIQSFWSKPMLNSDKETYQNRLNGGWRNYRYALVAMTYSCLTLRKYYNNVELYTDKFGINLFQNELKLPYTRFHNILSDLDVDNSFWAYGKILTYSLQKEPFLHVDNDIFIWDKFPERLNQADVVGQNIEWITPSITDDYISALDFLRKYVPVCPQILLQSECRQAVNMGVFGGSDIDFIRHYALLAIKSIKDATPYLQNSKTKNGVFNIIFEQLLLSEMAQKENRSIAFIVENCNSSDFTQYINIDTAQFDVKYAHCIGLLKQSDIICKHLEYRLRCDYPRYYEKILQYLEKLSMDFEENEQSMTNYEMFARFYKHLLPYQTKEEVLTECEFRLNKDYTIEYENDSYYIVKDNLKNKLKRWGTFLIYFQDFVKGIDVVNYIYTNRLLGNMDRKKISESIFFLIIQSLYTDKYLEVKEKYSK